MYMTTIPVAEARQQFSALVDDAVKTHNRVHVTRNGKPAVVMLSSDDYESLMETIDVLSDHALVRDVIESNADEAAGRYFTGEEMAEILAARAAGVDLGDHADVIADMHAAGVPDSVCLAALRAIAAAGAS
jgi:antitoxin YefM